jgi:hypothetical protein
MYSDYEAALFNLNLFVGPGLQLKKSDRAKEGPCCEGGPYVVGEHDYYCIPNSKKHGGSITSCPCCTNTAKGAEITALYRIPY